MNFVLSLDLLLYGLTLAGLSLLAHHLAPPFTAKLLVVDVLGGGLTAFWGVLGLRGCCRRIWPIVTLSILTLVLLVQTANACIAWKAGVAEAKPAAVIFTVLLVFSVGQILNLMQAGPPPEANPKSKSDCSIPGTAARGGHHPSPGRAIDK